MEPLRVASSFASSENVPLVPAMVKTAPTNRLPFIRGGELVGSLRRSITLVKVTVILPPGYPPPG